MRVAVIDLGTNSTRLLVADVRDDRVVAGLARESRVTRLGQAVDSTGLLQADAIDRVLAVLDDYHATIERLGAETTTAVMTSAVRDARNGEDFAAAVRARYALDARTLDGTEEAHLTFLGATSERADTGGRIAVVDIGGGSTEIVVGRGEDVSFFVSLQAGVVRQTERHFDSDPPTADEIAGLREEVGDLIVEHVPADVRTGASAVVAVAGTATSSAAIHLGVEPYDPERVHGYHLATSALERILLRVAAVPEAERRAIPGLHPDRAPTIVAGVAMLAEVAKAFELRTLEVSEHDILRGAALCRARDRSADRPM